MRDIEFLKINGVDVDKSLELFGDIETYNDTIGEFLVGANEKLPKIKYYKDMKDMANYAILVHSLKSDAKYFGFTKLADLAYQHELKSKENDYYFVYENFDGWTRYYFLNNNINYTHERHNHGAGYFGYGTHSTSHIETLRANLKKFITKI